MLTFTCTGSLPPEKPYLCFELFSSFVLQFSFTLLPFFELFQLILFSKYTSPLRPLRYVSKEERKHFSLRGHFSFRLHWKFLFSSVAYCSAVLSHIPAHLSPYIFGILPPVWRKGLLLFQLHLSLCDLKQSSYLSCSLKIKSSP